MRHLLLITAVLFLAGCATQIDTKKEKSIYESYIETQKLESLDKIRTFRFHGWRSLDNHYLIISTGLNNPYLIKLTNYCSDLRFAHRILVNSSGSTLTTKFDSIQVVDSSLPDRHPIKCFIKSIYKLSKEQADELGSLNKQSKDKTNKEKENNEKVEP